MARLSKFAACGLLMIGLCVQSASAQNGERLREFQAHRQAVANGQEKKPNLRAMAGLPPKWVERIREMPPDQQQRFLENSEQFNRLPPERQRQILQNLDKWNKLSPEQKEAVRQREAWLESLSPAQRQYLLNVVWPRWQSMPPQRKQVINRHLGMLRNMSPATQQAALNDPRFMQGLSPDEQSMLRDLNSLRNPAPLESEEPPQP